ncbi:hypothetical protein HDV02_000986 [Globomyces sp. JEL0801]|nr:hypothetical protein HDV02_000986 [Globomyces sp. JEL0801]
MKTPKDQPPKYPSLTQSSKLNINRKSFSFAKPNADWKSNSTLYGSSILYQSIDHQLPLKELVKYKRPVMYAVEIADVQCPPSLIKSGSVTSSITEDDSDEFKTFGQNEPIGSYLSSQNNFIKSLLNLNPPDIIQDSTQNIRIDRSRSKILSSQFSLSSLDKRRASLVVSDISERQKLNESELLDQLHINVDEKIFIQNMSLKSDLGSSALQRIFDRAAKYGKSHILMCLLENHKKHIDYSIVEELVIRAAVQNGNIKLLELLLRDNSATTRAYVNENLRLACTLGLSVIVQMILDDGRADPAISHNDPLKIACRQGHVIICKMLIETEKCDPNDSHGNHSPLTLACEYGHVKIVEYLLGLKHIDPAILDQKPITLAVLKGRVQIMEHLLKNPFVDPSVENNKFIQIACQNGHDKIVQQLLLDSKVNPAVRDNTPLLNACQNNREKIVKILMSKV